MPLSGGFSVGGATAAEVWAESTRTLTSGGGLSLTFDNVRTSLTASQTDETIPATGESDSGIFINEALGESGDTISISSNSGTSFIDMTNIVSGLLLTPFNTFQIISIGNSTGRYRQVMDSGVATRLTNQVITTVS